MLTSKAIISIAKNFVNQMFLGHTTHLQFLLTFVFNIGFTP